MKTRHFVSRPSSSTNKKLSIRDESISRYKKTRVQVFSLQSQLKLSPVNNMDQERETLEDNFWNNVGLTTMEMEFLITSIPKVEVKVKVNVKGPKDPEKKSEKKDEVESVWSQDSMLNDQSAVNNNVSVNESGDSKKTKPLNKIWPQSSRKILPTKPKPIKKSRKKSGQDNYEANGSKKSKKITNEKQKARNKVNKNWSQPLTIGQLNSAKKKILPKKPLPQKMRCEKESGKVDYEAGKLVNSNKAKIKVTKPTKAFISSWTRKKATSDS